MANYILNETAVVISDLHVGDPVDSRLEDFDRDEDFVHLLSEVIPQEVGWPVTLIINGDFIDFPQVLPELGKHSAGDRFGVTKDRSLLRLQRVIDGHPLVFSALKDFIERGGQVLILPGNHDIDFHWSDVFAAFRKSLGDAPISQLRFVKEGEIQEQGVHIEHGNQYSFDNWFEFWQDPIIMAPDNCLRLERPWGTLFMDLVYNDIEDLYPFVNKVYPHSTLAWAALRSFCSDERVSARAIARLIAFFLTKGRRFIQDRLLGEGGKEVCVDYASSGHIEAFLREIEINASEIRLIDIARETSLLLPRFERSAVDSIEEFLPGYLGQTDEWGMSSRQIELLQSGEVTLVAFGHTHVPVDGNLVPPWGEKDPRRAFNTGSWMPQIKINEYESPCWTELYSREKVNDIKYLVIDLTQTPIGRLVSLPCISD
jgi:UDP-2,3-diacylglucosamine pyrophosphatase LpxH